MKILELFSGTKSFSKVAEERGHKTFTVDILKKFNPSLCKNIMELNAGEILDKFGYPNIIWASPPCTEYSHAKRRGKRNLDYADSIVKKTLEIIKQLKPKIWIMENPQTGLLKDRTFMKGIPYMDISYCKYGKPYRKQTRLWTNLTNWVPKPICKKDCKFMNGNKHLHNIANGRKKYTEKYYKLEEKYQIPRELCEEILIKCEEIV